MIRHYYIGIDKCPFDFKTSKKLYTKLYPLVISNRGIQRAHVKVIKNIPLL